MSLTKINWVWCNECEEHAEDGKPLWHADWCPSLKPVPRERHRNVIVRLLLWAFLDYREKKP